MYDIQSASCSGSLLVSAPHRHLQSQAFIYSCGVHAETTAINLSVNDKLLYRHLLIRLIRHTRYASKLATASYTLCPEKSKPLDNVR